MASVSLRLASAAGLPGISPAFLTTVLAAPVALAVGRVLPAEGGGLALRLAAAALLVLVIPGWLFVCALGRPTRPGLALAASLVWSLAMCFLAYALTFAAGASLPLAIAALAILSGGALLAALRAVPAGFQRDDLRAVAWLVLLGVALCGLVWWSAVSVTGDELYQLARVRKLDEVPALFGVSAVSELRGGGPGPASAFPLWEGVLALIGRLAGVDASLVVQHVGGVLVPLAVVLSFAAGRELFGRVAAGIATAVAQLVVVALPLGGIGALAQLAGSATASRLLIVPALLALAFAWIADRRWLWLATAGVGGLALAAVRPSHLVFLVLGLVGFALVRLLGGARGRADAGLVGLLLAALVVAGGLFFAWLWPFASDANAFLPTAPYRAAAAALHDDVLVRVGDFFSLEAGALAGGGAGVVAGLAATVAAVFGVRRRWGAFVVGSTLALLATALVPVLFWPLSELVTLPEAARLAVLLPLPFSLAGAALLAATAGAVGVAAAAGLGLGLALAFGAGDAGGPAWAVWLAVAGCLVALAARRDLDTDRAPARLAVAAIVALAVPVAAVGLTDLEQDARDPRALPAPLVELVRAQVPARAVVFADLEAGYRLAAAAPITIVAQPARYGTATATADVAGRRRDVIAFFRGDGLSYLDRGDILSRYSAGWLLVDRERGRPDYPRFLPAPIFDDGRYAFYDLHR